ncbi:hypothetical protein [Luteococcus peritonei]|uniref:Lipoprotein n=1 Tax=Luteococcus peritonei TaxID=88874 RepID=A0ABW4RTH0_9ACTN
MKIARIAAPVAALLLMAGCATPSGGTAFDVDGTRTSVEQVDTAAEGCARLTQTPAEQIHTQVAQMLLSGSMADAISERAGVPITNQMIAKPVKALRGEQLMTDPDCKVAVESLARYAAINDTLGEAKSRNQVKALDVQVNPRYGNWNPSAGTFTGQTGSLSMQDLGQGKVFGN